MSTDKIEKKILLRAPRSRVWRAISDSTEFGTWFGIKFNGPFKAGAKMDGVLTPSMVIPSVGKAQEPYAGMKFGFTIERIEPERLFSFRWHPNAIDPKVDYSNEPATLVELVIEDAPGGVMLTITESGFDQIPLARRAEAFKSNDGGWTEMVQVIEAYIGNKA